MPEQPVTTPQEVDEKFQALLTNANAARVVAKTVEGTIGPKGLDTMMVDRFGDVVITNDGVTILKLMEVSHPAARMIINAAKNQQDKVGDGTTTTTIIASNLVAEGTSQVLKGVPVTKVIEGIALGIKEAEKQVLEIARPVTSLHDPLLYRIALISARENQHLADQVMEAARLTGTEKLMQDDYNFADAVVARAGAASSVFMGVLLNKEPLNRDMPGAVDYPRILVIDDALEPEQLPEEALSTDTGARYQMELDTQFEVHIRRLVEMGVKVVMVDRGVDDRAEEILTEAGVMVLERVSHRELLRVCEHTGARMVKRIALKRDPGDLARCLGQARRVEVNRRHGYTVVMGGEGKPLATVLVGAATDEVVDEEERMARDAAAALQAALKGGMVPGGGACELYLTLAMENLSRQVHGMASYGVLCVREALTRPFACLVANAGFNPLEKLGDVLAAQSETGNHALALDCDRGQVADMWEIGVVDPVPVKINGLKAAGEVARAILRINTIVKKKEVAGEEFDFA
ncbi:MAG: TCP-1/cpn60 chaperonin family protein [Methylocystaceae bacterium]